MVTRSNHDASDALEHDTVPKGDDSEKLQHATPSIGTSRPQTPCIDRQPATNSPRYAFKEFQESAPWNPLIGRVLNGSADIEWDIGRLGRMSISGLGKEHAAPSESGTNRDSGYESLNATHSFRESLPAVSGPAGSVNPTVKHIIELAPIEEIPPLNSNLAVCDINMSLPHDQSQQRKLESTQSKSRREHNSKLWRLLFHHHKEKQKTVGVSRPQPDDVTALLNMWRPELLGAEYVKTIGTKEPQALRTSTATSPSGESSEEENSSICDSSESLSQLDDEDKFHQVKSEVAIHTLLAYDMFFRRKTNRESTEVPPSMMLVQQSDDTTESFALSSTNDTSNQKGKGKKRTYDESHNCREEKDEEDRDSSKRRSHSPKQSTDNVAFFACPFAKKDPVKYRSCYGYVLKRIKDVKQHINRNHQLPIYCGRCKSTFESEADRDTHLQSLEICEIRNDIRHDGATKAQCDKMSKRVSCKLPPSEQWFELYEILFPGCLRPSSPYINNDLSVDLERFQDFMLADGLQIIFSTLLRRGLVTHGSQYDRDRAALYQEALREGLQWIAEDWVAAHRSDSATDEPGVGPQDAMDTSINEIVSMMCQSCHMEVPWLSARIQGHNIVCPDCEMRGSRPTNTQENYQPHSEPLIPAAEEGVDDMPGPHSGGLATEQEAEYDGNHSSEQSGLDRTTDIVGCEAIESTGSTDVEYSADEGPVEERIWLLV